jgi:hypothetical protein
MAVMDQELIVLLALNLAFPVGMVYDFTIHGTRPHRDFLPPLFLGCTCVQYRLDDKLP